MSLRYHVFIFVYYASDNRRKKEYVLFGWWFDCFFDQGLAKKPFFR